MYRRKEVHVQLLAPAGNMDSARAAVQNGANAIYLGLKLFSARAYAGNFNYDELKEVVEYCHLRSVSVYLTLNTLIEDSKLKAALNAAIQAAQCNVDAIILQDLGLASLISKALPDMPLHASTQISVIQPQEALFLKQKGFTRVISAREATIEQIEALCNTGMEVEIFAHGSLCVSYSGQCLLSYFNGGKSGNKGMCAQPCRLEYSLEDEHSKLASGHLLSTKDIALMQDIERVKEAGVVSIKLEGRMKSPDYVAVVTNTYRKALDNTVTEKDRMDALMMFNREGFSRGYAFSKAGKHMMAYNFAGNTGVPIGKVLKVNKEKSLIQIQSSRELINGDGISFVQSKLGSFVDIIRRNGDLYGLVVRNGIPSVGDDVYLTFDKELNERAVKSYSDDFKRKVPIQAVFSIDDNKHAVLSVLDDLNNTVSAVSLVQVQKAESPAAMQNIERSLSRVGATVYSLDKLTMDTPYPVFLPVSEVNNLRRDALDKLSLVRISGSRNRDNINNKDNKTQLQSNNPTVLEDLDAFMSYENLSLSDELNKEPAVSVFFYKDRPDVDIAGLGANRIYMPFDMYERNKKDERAYKYVPIGVSLKDVINKEDTKIVSSSFGILNIDKFDNTDTVGNTNNEQRDMVLDFGINCLNSHTLDFLKSSKQPSAICLSYEMDIRDIEYFKDIEGISLEYIGYGRVPVMKTKYNINDAFDQKQELHLVDRKKKNLDIVNYGQDSTSYILGAFTVNNYSKKDLIRQMGADTLRINIFDESVEEIEELIAKFL